MLLKRLWGFFQDNIFSTIPSERPDRPLCNFYRERLPEADHSHAPNIRQDNLRRYLESFTTTPQILMIGEVPGWRGCRFSGVPFTSEAQLVGKILPFDGNQSSAASTPYKEATATIFWQLMAPYYPSFLVWNCIPFHPHQPGVPLSNRTPSQLEITCYRSILKGFIAQLRPNLIIAIGRQPEKALQKIGVSATVVRHPSHGGSKLFQSQITAIMSYIDLAKPQEDMYNPSLLH